VLVKGGNILYGFVTIRGDDVRMVFWTYLVISLHAYYTFMPLVMSGPGPGPMGAGEGVEG
jgi:hypothetical protein